MAGCGRRGFARSRRPPVHIRSGEEVQVRRSPQAAACRKRDVEDLGKPQTFLPWQTSVYGLQLLRHGRGNPDTEPCWHLHTAVAHAQAGGGGRSQGKPTACGGGVLSRRVLGGGESPRQGEGRDGSTQPAQATSAGHRRPGAPAANLPAGDSQQRGWPAGSAWHRGSEDNRSTGCGKTARPGLYGGCRVTGIPTVEVPQAHRDLQDERISRITCDIPCL